MKIIRSETLGRRLASAKSLDKSLANSLTKSLAETLSETLGETFGETLYEILGETFGETLGETLHARQASPQSLGSDYMHGSPQDSLRNSFFYVGGRIRILLSLSQWWEKIAKFFISADTLLLNAKQEQATGS